MSYIKEDLRAFRHWKLVFLITVVIVVIAGCAVKNSPPLETAPDKLHSNSDPSDNPLDPAVHSIPPSLRFERINTSNGLSSNAVRKIYQDHVGFLWIGTQDGLNKYDGYEFKVFRYDPSLPGTIRDNFIETIYEDSSGVLWIGTQSGWLERYDPGTDNFSHFQLGSRVLSIFEDSYANLWVGTFKPGLFLFDRETETGELILPEENISSIAEDPEGKIWIANQSDKLIVVDPHTYESITIPTAYPVNQLLSQRDDKIWTGTNGGGIGVIDPSTKTVTFQQTKQKGPPNTDWISILNKDNPGRLWFGSWGNGLFAFDPKSGTLENYQYDPLIPTSISNNDVVTALVDRSGILWVGNEFGGLNKANLNSFDFGYYHHNPNNPDSLPDGIVTSFSEDENGLLWIGTLSGLSAWNREEQVWKNYLEVDGIEFRVRSLYRDQYKQLWVGTESGLYLYDRRSDQLTHYDTPVVMWMMEDSGGTFWMATKEGLYKFNPENGETQLILKGISWKIMVFEDTARNIWVGSSGDGLDRMDPETGEWHHFSHNPDDPGSLSGNFVETIHQDSRGQIWIGTNNGLNRYDPETETYSHYFVTDGLPHNYVSGILEDLDGNLWLSTQGGLSKFDPQSEEFENYFRSDGLQGNAFWRNSYFQNDAGEMFFGGVNGFNTFTPTRIEKSPFLPPIRITSVNLFNEPAFRNIDNGDLIELSFKENFLSFEFVSLDFSDPSNNLFAYQMIGIDEDWVEIGKRNHVDYPNLGPGEYTFRVIGSNSDGLWNETGAWVNIVIDPPFWMTWWFRGSLISILIAILIGSYRIRINQMVARTNALELEVEKRTAELLQETDQRIETERALADSMKEKAVSDERNRLAQELHDAVTQGLFSASLLAEALPIAWQENPEEAKKLLNDLRSLNRGALAEMRTLLLELRPAVLIDVEMGDLLRQLTEAAGARESIIFLLEIDEKCDLPDDVHLMVYRIAQETLNNIIKHAQCDNVTITYKDFPGDDGTAEKAILTIIDDGVGFEQTSISPGRMGLTIMKERAQSVGADLKITSQKLQGTSVELVWTQCIWEGIQDE